MGVPFQGGDRTSHLQVGEAAQGGAVGRGWEAQGGLGGAGGWEAQGAISRAVRAGLCAVGHSAARLLPPALLLYLESHACQWLPAPSSSSP